MVHFAYRSCSHVMNSQMQNEVPFMKENRLLFTNALIVLPTETIKGSLAVEDGKITGIFESGTELPGFTEVDVHGKALMPGAIDTHVHMWDPSPLNYREDWACGSQCAASGGITTIIDMPLSVPPVVDKEGFQLKLDVAQKESCVDFAFWGGLTPNCVQNMEELNRLGCVAYKGFMSFANPDYPQVTDGYLVQGMRKAATFNGLIGVHAENAEVADFGSKEMSAIHCKDFAMHDDARPWWVEQEAISRAVLFARETGARLYICHMTIAQGAAFLKQAKFEGVNVSVETCPHYLLFDKTILRERGAYAKCNPPFRSRENVEKLWSYISIIYISHRLEELFEITDRITVMRDGAFINTFITKESSLPELIRSMVGREVSWEKKKHSNVAADAPVLLEVQGMESHAIKNASFKLRKGEILGIGGLMGAGRTELARLVFGADWRKHGKILKNGEEIQIRTPHDAVKNGIGYISEDRKALGLALKLSVADNIAMPNWEKFTSHGVVNEKEEMRVAAEMADRVMVKTPSVKQLVMNLSGGNQQKVAIAKWLLRDCDILIFDEPTRGIDIGAKSEIYNLINELIAQGKSIIMISSEMQELLSMSDRIIVMCEGSITGELDIADATQESIMALAVRRAV